MEKKQTKEEEKIELLERELKETKAEYKTLEGAYSESEEALADAEGAEAIERHLKNEAYAFLLANGLLDKFLEFRSNYHRTKQEDSIYLLAMSSDQGGLWIDLG